MNRQDGGEREPMLDMFLFESNGLLESLEEILLRAEKAGKPTRDDVNEIFRIMHTFKGSAGMMMFGPIATLAHAVEDLFAHIREQGAAIVDFRPVCDIVLQAGDALREQIRQIEENQLPTDADPMLIQRIHALLEALRGDAGSIGTSMPASPKKEAGKSAEARKSSPKRFYISKYNHADVPPAARYEARIRFDEGCGMENIRAYSMVFSLQEQCTEVHHDPADLIGDTGAADRIVQNGLILWFASDLPESELKALLDRALFVRTCTLARIDAFPAEAMPGAQVKAMPESMPKRPVIRMPDDEPRQGVVDLPVPTETPRNATAENTGSRRGAAERLEPELPEGPRDGERAENARDGERAENVRDGERAENARDGAAKASKSSLISVNIHKLDALMDLVGEIVITESMVTRCPELAGLPLDVFYKSANQLRKLTDELQDIVMSIRMLPIANTFQKMHRIVRDMGKRLGKEAELVLVGEETEVDKNLIDQLADPLMHLVRNAMDHGLETIEERVAAGKPVKGTVMLEARNDGGEIWISVRDDGKGLNRERILAKAREHGLTTKADAELSDREIFGFVMLPGFSTKEKVSEFSGRGVGMDVVRENITRMGGSVSIESQWGRGSSVIIRIPLTLAIIDGMLISVGDASYIIPTMAIRESLRADASRTIRDASGNELIMIRGEAFPLIRLDRRFGNEGRARRLEEGILIVIEHEGTRLALFADELLGEQHVVVKPLPAYFRQVRGISGCTILGDGSISLILDVGGMDN